MGMGLSSWSFSPKLVSLRGYDSGEPYFPGGSPSPFPPRGGSFRIHGKYPSPAFTEPNEGGGGDRRAGFGDVGPISTYSAAFPKVPDKRIGAMILLNNAKVPSQNVEVFNPEENLAPRVREEERMLSEMFRLAQDSPYAKKMGSPIARSVKAAPWPNEKTKPREDPENWMAKNIFEYSPPYWTP
jgi:hypothetical protein